VPEALQTVPKYENTALFCNVVNILRDDINICIAET
jgi:hypothetical protein